MKIKTFRRISIPGLIFLALVASAGSAFSHLEVLDGNWPQRSAAPEGNETQD